MAECECLSGCPFFNDRMQEMPGLTKIYKKRYCQDGDNDDCARHQVKVALGKENVPNDLYPNQLEKAKTIIEKSILK